MTVENHDSPNTSAPGLEAGPISASRPRSNGDSERYREILQTAASIFSERGFHATSINEIAESVSLTKAGLYYYIKGKGDLLYRIMDLAMQSIELTVIDVAKDIRDPERRLEAIVRGHAALVTQEGSAGFVAILVDELGSLAAEPLAAIKSRQKRYVDFLRGTLVELREQDRLRPGIDPLAAAYSLLGMVLWTSRWFRAGDRLSPDDVADQLSALALGGVLAVASPGTSS